MLTTSATRRRAGVCVWVCVWGWVMKLLREFKEVRDRDRRGTRETFSVYAGDRVCLSKPANDAFNAPSGKAANARWYAGDGAKTSQ